MRHPDAPNNSIYESSPDALKAAKLFSSKLGDLSSVAIIDYGYDRFYPWKSTLRVVFILAWFDSLVILGYSASWLE